VQEIILSQKRWWLLNIESMRKNRRSSGNGILYISMPRLCYVNQWDKLFSCKQVAMCRKGEEHPWFLAIT
jgi:hypothetical protein